MSIKCLYKYSVNVLSRYAINNYIITTKYVFEITNIVYSKFVEISNLFLVHIECISGFPVIFTKNVVFMELFFKIV